MITLLVILVSIAIKTNEVAKIVQKNQNSRLCKEMPSLSVNAGS